MEKLLLHACCGPCSAFAVESMRKQYDMSLFFYNPNISDEAEHKRRFENAKLVAQRFGVPIINMEYNPSTWSEAVKGLESEKEGGKRCEACFRFRLEETAKFAKDNGFSLFSTTLTASPFKNAALINAIGAEVGQRFGVKFLTLDLKMGGGYKRGLELSKEFSLYRQKYCGCVYSIQNR